MSLDVDAFYDMAYAQCLDVEELYGRWSSPFSSPPASSTGAGTSADLEDKKSEAQLSDDSPATDSGM
eukprot:4669198-Prorocentrum_lima.AAC.1